MNRALADVLRERARVRADVEDRGTGWWLTDLRNRLVTVLRLMGERRPNRDDVRDQLVRQAAAAVLAVEAFDAEQDRASDTRRRAA